MTSRPGTGKRLTFLQCMVHVILPTCHRDRIQRGPASHLFVYVENKYEIERLKKLGFDWSERRVVLFSDW